MEVPYFPTRQDVERYRRLRALNRYLNAQMVETIPQRAFDEIGDAIGVLHNGRLVFDDIDVTSVFMDCCLYDWFEDGKNLVKRYAEAHPAKPGTDESYMLSAAMQAKYRVLLTQSTVPDAGLRCYDVLNREDLFLMDLAFSRSIRSGDAMLATRTIPLGEYWMTGGAALPIHSAAAIKRALSRVGLERHKGLEGPGALPLSIVRACLATGAINYIAYAGAERTPKKPRREPRWPGSKRRHRPT